MFAFCSPPIATGTLLDSELLPVSTLHARNGKLFCASSNVSNHMRPHRHPDFEARQARVFRGFVNISHIIHIHHTIYINIRIITYYINRHLFAFWTPNPYGSKNFLRASANCSRLVSKILYQEVPRSSWNDVYTVLYILHVVLCTYQINSICCTCCNRIGQGIRMLRLAVKRDGRHAAKRGQAQRAAGKVVSVATYKNKIRILRRFKHFFSLRYLCPADWSFGDTHTYMDEKDTLQFHTKQQVEELLAEGAEAHIQTI